MSNTPKPQANKTIDEIVEELFEMGILTGIGKANIDVSGAKRLAIKAIQAHYRAEVLDMIGEDEEQLLPNSANDNYDAIQRLVGRNQQRAQLRKAAKERFK